MKFCNFDSILVSNVLLENGSTLKNEKYINNKKNTYILVRLR